MQISTRSSGCLAIVLMALAAPAVAQDRAFAAAVPTVAAPKITLVPDLAARAVVPTLAPAVFHQTSAAAATNGIATPAVVTPAIATVKPMDAPRIDLMPRTVVTSQPGVMSRRDVRATHEATKALTTRGRAATGRDAASAEASGDTRLAASSTGTVTDAVAAAEPAPNRAGPRVMPTCR